MNRPNNKRGQRPNKDKEKSEFDQTILDLARVTRVTKGGKQMSFRCSVLLGDRHGRIGLGVAKGKDVQLGVEKAVRQAKKNMIDVPIINETIPHATSFKYKIAQVILKPAPRGSGIIAGGAVRVVMDLAGIPNVSAKILSKSKNKMTIAKATLGALQSFKKSAVDQARAQSKSRKVEEAPKQPVEEAKNKPAIRKPATAAKKVEQK